MAGFDVVGVDNRPQPRYPYKFVKADALNFLEHNWWRYSAIHASPPCQAFSVASVQDGHGRKRERNPHEDLIKPTRILLRKCKLWVIENVVGAPLRKDLMLCGKMFGLNVARHRIFECYGFDPYQPQHVYPHSGRVVTVAGNPGGSSKRDGLKFAGAAERREAMGIDWMSSSELKEALPPLYTRHIGRYLLKAWKEQR